MLESKQDPSVGLRCDPLRHQPSHGNQMSALEYQVCKHLKIMKYVHREPFPEFGRTKYIMMPERAMVAGNHDVNLLKNPDIFKSYKVNSHIAYHRHYRDFPSSHKTTVDQIDVQVGLKLAKRVAKQINNFKSECKLKDRDIFV